MPYDPDAYDSIGSEPPPTFILDATGDTALLKRIFPGVAVQTLPPPEWPANVKVVQITDKIGSRKALGLYPKQWTFSASSKAKREEWYSRLAKELRDFPRDWPVLRHAPVCL